MSQNMQTRVDPFKQNVAALDDNNWHEWITDIGEIMNAVEGWQSMYDFSLIDMPDDDKEAKKLIKHQYDQQTKDSRDRKIAFRFVKNYLTSTVKTRVRQVKIGEVEELLRQLRNHYDIKGTTSKRTLLKELREARLTDHQSLLDYFATIDNLVERLNAQQKRPDDEDICDHILDGLNDDYDAAVNALRLPNNDNYTVAAVKTYLNEYLQARPNIYGHATSKRKGKHGNATYSIQTRGICHHFAKHGSCKYGNKCKYAHVAQPSHHSHINANNKNNNNKQCYRCGKKDHKTHACPHKQSTCTYCNKRGHIASACKQKQRDMHKNGNSKPTHNLTFTTQHLQLSTKY